MVFWLNCFHTVVVFQSGIEFLHLTVTGSQMAERPQMIRFQHIGFQISIHSFLIAFLLLQAEACFLENIRIGKKTATDEEVIRAARLANCEEFIRRLPEGYKTMIGENGATLSGGERQRLSIARAFLKDSPIIILDEIAASLDVENEKKIQDSLNRLILDKTVIIISHRLKSVENADRIVVIDCGRVEASGTHLELLKASPTYNNLVEKAKLTEEFQY